jgi:hypothetical protein
MNRRVALATLPGLVGLSALGRNLGLAAQAEPSALPPIATYSFDAETRLDDWTFTDRKAWRITKLEDGDPGQYALEQFQQSVYEPAVRSPFNFVLLPAGEVADFELTVEARSTAEDTPYKDVCLVFGYQDASHFLYTHLGQKADDVHHQVHIVDGAPRKAITENRSFGTPWTKGWHTLRLRYQASDGRIEVRFDETIEPILTAHSTRFARGRVGLGTFDDTAQFRRIVLAGTRPGASGP